MRKRIYWVLPDHESALRTMHELLLARLGERQIHFMAREGTSMQGLHAANVLQTSDLVSAAQNGGMAGSAMGAALGVVAAFELAGFVSAPAVLVVAMAAIGAVMGAWLASMIGSSVPSRRLQRFEAAMDAGAYLLMVDVPRTRVTEIELLLERTHPEAHFEGMEPNVPAFP
ncbi:MAG: DUF1269 domain-containing protein [Burkholderiaceae bacterium]|nr:DUF1269 domain-containing protein [Roseateles sp.]MBV8469615.1 DUF1269 domain-containing protein [Burkholderiaceae bacterium]